MQAAKPMLEIDWKIGDGIFSELTSIGDDGTPLLVIVPSVHELNTATRANALHDKRSYWFGY